MVCCSLVVSVYSTRMTAETRDQMVKLAGKHAEAVRRGVVCLSERLMACRAPPPAAGSIHYGSCCGRVHTLSIW